MRAEQVTWRMLGCPTKIGLYRVAEEARVTAAELRQTQKSILEEQDTLAILGAEWARVTQPSRIQALAQRQLDLNDKPAAALTSLTQLPEKIPPLAPEGSIRNVNAVAPLAPNSPRPSSPDAQAAPAPTIAQMKTGT